MKLEKLAAISEIVSSAAIVATLVYIGLQTQQTNSALFANSRAQIMSADVAIVGEAANTPLSPTSRSFIRGFVPPGVELSEEDYEAIWQQYHLLAGMIRIREFAWFQFQDGLLDERAWNGYMATMERNIGSGLGRILWGLYKPELDTEFVAYVDARMADQ